MEAFCDKFQKGFVGEITFASLFRGLAGRVAYKLRVLSSNGVIRVGVLSLGQGEIIGQRGRLQVVCLLIMQQRLGGEFAGLPIEFSGRKQGLVQKYLQPDQRVSLFW